MMLRDRRWEKGIIVDGKEIGKSIANGRNENETGWEHVENCKVKAEIKLGTLNKLWMSMQHERRSLAICDKNWDKND